MVSFLPVPMTLLCLIDFGYGVEGWTSQVVTLRQHTHSWMSASGDAGLGGLSSLARVLGWFIRYQKTTFGVNLLTISDNGKHQQRSKVE